MSTGGRKKLAVVLVALGILGAAGFWLLSGKKEKAHEAAVPTAPTDKVIEPVTGTPHSEDHASHEGEVAEKLPPISHELAEEIRRLENRDWEENIDDVVTEEGVREFRVKDGFKSTRVAVIDENGKLVLRHGGDFLNNVEPPEDAENNPGLTKGHEVDEQGLISVSPPDQTR